MVIGVDGNEANIKERVGVNVYAHEILKNLHELQDEWKDRHTFRIYLSAPPRADMPVELPGLWEYKILPGGGLWIVRKLVPRLYFEEDKPDIFFSPSHYSPPIAPMARVCSIMDLGYLEHSGQFKAKDYWQLRLWTAWSLRVAKSVIAISSFTRENIVRQYKFAKNKVDATPLGYDKAKFNSTISQSEVNKAKKKYKISNNYILFLSTLKPSKNVEGLVKAWARIENKFVDTELVIAGKKGWLYQSIYESAEALGISSRVIFTGYVAEKMKPGIVAGAKLFVLPSFWEGFGLDVLSAMASGVPVMVSDRGSLPEVVGKAGIVVSPEDPDLMARSMEKVLKMGKNDYNKLVNKGIRQAEKFDWEKTARQTLAVFEKLQK